jgi:hypothetical protein
MIYGIVHLLVLMEFVNKFKKKHGIKKYGSLYLIQTHASNSQQLGARWNSAGRIMSTKKIK